MQPISDAIPPCETTCSGDSCRVGSSHTGDTIAEQTQSEPCKQGRSSVESSPDEIASVHDSVKVRNDHRSLPSSDDSKKESTPDTASTSSTAAAAKSSTQRNKLNLELRISPETRQRSASSPYLTPHETSVDLLSPMESPAEFLTPPQGAVTTPSYAKVRHIAQSPVAQLTHIAMTKNPYMSPFYASDDLLKTLPPVYFVVSLRQKFVSTQVIAKAL